MIKVNTKEEQRICQGDIYQNIEYIEYAVEKQGIVEISTIVFPLVMVLTQDCDLKWDYTFRFIEPRKPTQDKYLLSILVAPIYNVEHFYDGDHLSELNIKMINYERRDDRSPNKSLKNNEVPRYHYLEFPPEVPIVPSVIDFKHYFSVNVQSLMGNKSSKFVCKVSELYREDICRRFANFLSRIGLP